MDSSQLEARPAPDAAANAPAARSDDRASPSQQDFCSSKAPGALTRSLGTTTGLLLVAANMIGTGVFTTTGVLMTTLPSAPAVLIAWAVGGASAMFGALAFAELGAALPHNGGEYRLLSRVYHPSLGFAAGCASLICGFSAPLALMALAFGQYLHAFWPAVPPLPAGLLLIVICSVLHAAHVGWANRFQNLFTAAKIALIVAFILGGWICCQVSHFQDSAAPPLSTALFSAPFAVGLVSISYAYAGWNAAAYVAGEFQQPARQIPRALVGGTALVSLLYLGLNAVFLAALPAAALAQSQERVGHDVALHLFGPSVGSYFSLLIMLGLISSVSALVMTGPRIYEAMGQRYPLLRSLAIRRAGGGPIVAIAVQAALAMSLMMVSGFAELLMYVGFVLSLFAALTVLGVVVLRVREPDLPRPYRTWGYPLTPLLFVSLQAWMLAHTIIQNPQIALSGLITVAISFGLYALLARSSAA